MFLRGIATKLTILDCCKLWTRVLLCRTIFSCVKSVWSRFENCPSLSLTYTHKYMCVHAKWYAFLLKNGVDWCSEWLLFQSLYLVTFSYCIRLAESSVCGLECQGNSMNCLFSVTIAHGCICSPQEMSWGSVSNLDARKQFTPKSSETRVAFSMRIIALQVDRSWQLEQ